MDLTDIIPAHASLQNVHVENGKLLIRATAPSEAVKNDIWDAIKQVDSNFADLVAEITVVEAQGPPQEKPRGVTQYTVKSGDTLSKIAKRFYGDANAYMRIFEANRDVVQDPNLIHPGDVLKIVDAD